MILISSKVNENTEKLREKGQNVQARMNFGFLVPGKRDSLLQTLDLNTSR